MKNIPTKLTIGVIAFLAGFLLERIFDNYFCTVNASTSITGIIKDSQNNHPIPNAELIIEGNTFAHSNEEGSATLKAKTNFSMLKNFFLCSSCISGTHFKVFVQHEKYQDTSLTIIMDEYNPKWNLETIYLTPSN